MIEDRGQTYRVLIFSFNPLRATVVTHTRAKDQDQRSVGSKDRVETDGWTGGGDCIFPCYAVGKNLSAWSDCSRLAITPACAKSVLRRRLREMSVGGKHARTDIWPR